MPLLPAAVLASWRRPGYAGMAFLVLALLVCLPFAVFAYGFADTRLAGVEVALLVAVPPFLIAALLIAASSLAKRAAQLHLSEPGPSPS
jgi:hypothetical protein